MCIRDRCLDKLARVPLGYVKDTSSGSFKNIIVERVDSMETTLAHIVPEFTSNLAAPLVVIIYLFITDWRIALLSLIPIVLGLAATCGMSVSYTHLAPETPGSINEGGELGYSIAHGFGAVFDNPDLIATVIVGDGEAETGPLATSWHSNKFLDPVTDGAVLPVLNLNGYKISNPTIFSRISHDAVSYTHLDVYKRQDPNMGGIQGGTYGGMNSQGMNPGMGGPQGGMMNRQGLDPVSYTHLDVYKRQVI